MQCSDTCPVRVLDVVRGSVGNSYRTAGLEALQTPTPKIKKMTHAGLEPAIFGFEDQRLIHWATRAVLM